MIKVIVIDLRSLVNAYISEVMPLEENLDTRLLITDFGHCYRENENRVTQVVSKETTRLVFNTFADKAFIMSDYYIEKQSLDTIALDNLINDVSFMINTFDFLLNNSTFTQLRLAEAVSIDKPTCKKLVTHLLSNRFISTYSTYFKVTKDNVPNILEALNTLKRNIQ